MAVKIGLLLVFASLCLGSALAFTVEESGDTTSLTWIGLFLAAGAVLLVADQVNFKAKKKHLPGPSFITPFIGEFWASLHPKFEAYQKQWNSGPLSCTQVFQKFIIIGSTNELSRKMFNTPGSLVPCLVAAMKQILTPENFVFLQGKAHVDYRKRLNPLFTKRALSIYLPIQQKTYKEHIDEWISLGGKPVEYQSRVRDLNMATSLAVFCGNYLSAESQRKISDEYYNLTQALQLVNFPLALPGTKVYNAIKARKYITEQIAQCALKSREKMSKPGAVPTSMLDAWIEVLIKEQQEYKQNGEQGPAPPTFSETDIGLTVLTFIFASQDASSSSVTWMLALLAEHRDVLEKLREEQRRLRPNNEEITYEMLEEMKYTRQVVKEILRYRPPVLMVPYEATKDCQITQDYVIPKGAIVVPSIWPTQHDPAVFKDPSKFDPDRFSPERAEDVNNPQHWLVFGHGPHGCIGKEYAMVHLIAFTAMLASSCDWKRIRTETSDGITIRPTIYPTDQCIVSLNALRV